MPNRDNSDERFRVGVIPNEPKIVTEMREAFAALDRRCAEIYSESKRDGECMRHSLRARELLDDASYHALKSAFIQDAVSRRN